MRAACSNDEAGRGPVLHETMNMNPSPSDTALVITDPQNDFLSPDAVIWGLVGENVVANNTVENIEELLKSAKESGYQVFISPHYY